MSGILIGGNKMNIKEMLMKLKNKKSNINITENGSKNVDELIDELGIVPDGNLDEFLEDEEPDEVNDYE